ncbi:MAG: TonB-dependent receptor domain-containing protein [Gammaproteobacteria bacterium]
MQSTLRKHLITLAVQMALTVSLVPATALAETPDVSQPVELGKIAVTGSAVSVPKPTSVKPIGPIQIISRQQIKASGLTSVGDILARLTIMGSGTNTAFNFGANGETCINLRNLGCDRVLVLVNGRRWPALITGEVDMNTIPLAVVDHIEVLKSGASAQYGSGAMAGVVNIVTKSDFNGSEASAYFGEYVEGGERDGQTQMYEFTHGMTDANSSFVFNASYTDQRPIVGGDRAITAFPSFGTGVSRGSSVTSQGRFIFIDPNTNQREDLTVITGTPGTSPADFRPFNPATDLYNYATINYLLTPSKRTGLYVQGSYDFNDNIGGHYTALYNDRRSEQQEGPAEFSIGSQGANPISVSATNPYNPFGFDLTATGASPNLLLLAYQPVEIGPRLINEDSQTFYFDGGLDGSFELAAHPFTWSVNAIVNRNTMTTLDGPELNLVNVANALGPVSNCGPGTANPSCVPLNLFSGQYNGGSITPAMANYITYTAQQYLETNQHDYTANISTPLVQLPAGPLQATLGYEYLNETGLDQPDALAAVGESSAGTNPPISGGYHANAGSLALSVPILANVPLAKLLSLDAVTRHSNYSSFGSINSNLAALHWFVNDQVALRASWSQDFNAPSMADLFTASVAGTASVADPCSNYQSKGGTIAANCMVAGVPISYTQVNPDVPSTSGRNPNLQPETSTSRTLGATVTPWQELPLSFNVDYFKIEVNNAIGSLNPQNVLNGCYISSLPNYCGFISRNASGAISNLQNGDFNLGTLLTEGVDFGTRYSLQTQRSGTFDFNWQVTWVKLFTQTQPNQADPSAPIITQLAGTETGRPKGGYPKFKSKLDARWTYGSWQTLWSVHYISDLIEFCSDRFDGTPQSLTNLGLCTYPNYTNNALSQNKMGAATYHDVQVKYAFADNKTTLTIGILNVFDKQPPVSHSIGSFDPTVYPIPGRFPYVSLSHSF